MPLEVLMAMELGSVRSFEAACVVPEDPGEVVRGARPTSSQDRERMREQTISRMMADYRRQKSGRLDAHSA
jgi:hypothetical protein